MSFVEEVVRVENDTKTTVSTTRTMWTRAKRPKCCRVSLSEYTWKHTQAQRARGGTRQRRSRCCDDGQHTNNTLYRLQAYILPAHQTDTAGRLLSERACAEIDGIRPRCVR
jgi:hypothetical protein